MLNTLIFYALKKLSDLKNNGRCFDSDGTDQFSCTCELPFVGAECKNDLCENTRDLCQNNGTCDIKSINGVLTPTCKCTDNYVGDFCELLSCVNDVPCYNSDTCDGQTCQCSQEYYGESCDMPAACVGEPCQNDGTCNGRTDENGTQVGFVINS